MINLQNKTPNILVIGDLMVDQYLWGACERISPEAPVQVINIDNESKLLGGAGNVINNLKLERLRNALCIPKYKIGFDMQSNINNENNLLTSLF